MAVTIRRPDGKEMVVNDLSLGSCREAVLRLGIVTDPRLEFRVVDIEKVDVSDRPLRELDGRMLTVAPKEIIGG